MVIYMPLLLLGVESSVFSDVMMDTQCDMGVIFSLLVVLGVLGVRGCRYTPLNSCEHTPKKDRCLFLLRNSDSPRVRHCESYMPFCNTRASHMCYDGVQRHDVMVPSF